MVLTPLRTAISVFLTALCMIVAAMLPASAATFQVKRGLNLDQWVTWPQPDRWGDKDAMLPYPEWRKFIDAEELAYLKRAGLDFLRMPVDPSPMLSPQGAALRQQLLDQVLEAVRLVNAAGLKVIVDFHMITWEDAVGMNQVLGQEDRFQDYLTLVRDMAKLLAKEDPAWVAFELMNEPGMDCNDPAGWTQKQKQLFAAARSSATRLTLILTGGCMSNAESLAELDPRAYVDDNLIWTFHSYQPFLLTTQGATWAGDFIRYVTGLPYPLSSVSRSDLDAILDQIRTRIRAEAPIARRAGMLSYLDEQIATIDTPEKLAAEMEKPFIVAADWAKRHGVPASEILLGEFGMIRQEYGQDFTVPASERAVFYRDMIALAEKHGFPWSMWSYGGAFGVVNAFGDDKAEPDLMEMIKGLPPAP
jgi:endoglucanase